MAFWCPKILRAMKSIFYLILGVMGLVPLSTIEASEKLSLPLSPELTRADLYVESCKGEARGTLVLCPGRNGNGQELIDNSQWVKFANDEKLNLVGISFASDDDPQDRGYFEISSGSGQILLDGLKQAFGSKQLPLLLYGFSRGAQFTYSFARWKPDLVIAWCAYSATRWEPPEKNIYEPKGIIACGEDDESNYSFSTLQFIKGRSMSKPWAWVSLGHQGHAWSSSLDEFVRIYFASVLAHPQSKGLWLDVDSKTPITPSDLREHPTLAAWLPDETAANAWKQLHQP
jgi:hypothetical protein